MYLLKEETSLILADHLSVKTHRPAKGRFQFKLEVKPCQLVPGSLSVPVLSCPVNPSQKLLKDCGRPSHPLHNT